MEKIVETKTCNHCNDSFKITDRDIEFYEKVSPTFGGEKHHIPTPTLCPTCREQRRLSALNQRKLYKTTCNLCKQETVARFHPESNINVFCNQCWSSDNWDALAYGIEFDFEKTFFEQINTLISTTPFQNLIGSYSNIENNAIYTNYTAEIHNSYMVVESDFVSDCMYGAQLRKSEYLLDCYNCSALEYCYECLDSDNMYNCSFSIDSSSCNNSHYIRNCHGCNFCIGCTNLKNKQYYIFNAQVTKDEFEDFYKSMNHNEVNTKFQELLKKEKINTDHIIGSENCTGKYIVNSHNAIDSQDILSCNDVKYCRNVNHSEDLMDISSYGSHSDHMYESLSVGRYSRNILFCSTVGKGEDLIYCIDTKKSKDCFGCVNLKGARYCILNKQYTKQEYETLVSKIIKHMKTTGEWGEFFPSSLSPSGYNETIAHEYFPLTRGEILCHSELDSESLESQDSNPKKDPGSSPGGQLIHGPVFNWSDYEAPFPKVEKIIPASKLPHQIEDIPDDILAWAIECEVTNKPFRIIKAELEFYRKHNLPIPKRHPDQRHLDRMKLRN